MWDKNLGPVLMQREVYIKLVLTQHLQDGKGTYQQISEATTWSQLFIVKVDIATLTSGTLPPLEATYFAKSLLQPFESFRDPVFYSMTNVHKRKSPVPLRPVVSQWGSLLIVASTYLDFRLQPLKNDVHSYIKNSYSLILKLQHIGYVPSGARVFTSDAVLMYTNINPSEGIDTNDKYIKYFDHNFSDEDREIIINLFWLVMTNCIFKFGDTFWKQSIDTAMGTPVACIYAILFFAYFERIIILQK